MSDITDILSSREAITTYIGGTIGFLHAVYDKVHHERKKQSPIPDGVAMGMGISIVGKTTLLSYIEGSFIGSFSYLAGYHTTYALLNKISKKQPEQPPSFHKMP